MQKSFSTSFFYLGTFITSFGSLLFVMSVPAFFIKSGYTLEIIGITIGIHRFSGIVASALFGPVIDRFNSRKTIFLTEFLAALSSIGLILAWLNRESFGLMLFGFFVGLRALTVGVQSSSRSRLIKLLSNEDLHREAGLAIWLNKVTQGAHVISSLVAIPLLASGNLYVAIALDGLSFLIGGYSALLLPDVDNEKNRSVQSSHFVGAILNLIKFHKFIFLQDQMLALTVSGTILLMVKLSGGDSTYVIYFNLLFGLCIWVSSLFAHSLTLRNRTISYWLTMSFGFILLTFSYESSWRFLAYFISYMGYWILFHKYTVEIQTKTPKDLIGATMAARGLTVAITLSLGELLGGYITRIFDVKVELFIRAVISLIVVVSLIISKIKLKKD